MVCSNAKFKEQNMYLSFYVTLGNIYTTKIEKSQEEISTKYVDQLIVDY